MPVFSGQNYLTRGFWGDEAWTSLISQLPYFQMLKTTAADFHPPAYYTVVSLVYKFSPETEVVTRAISIIFWLLTTLLVYKIGGEIKDRSFSILCAIVVSLNPTFFAYAFEARNYTMFAFAATASIYFLLRLSKNYNLKDLLFFIVSSTLGIYTHYYMFFVLTAELTYLIIFHRRIFLKFFLPFVAIGILYLPWVPYLFSQLTSVGESYWIPSIDLKTHYEAILRILGGEHQNFFRPLLFAISLTLLLLGIALPIFKKWSGKAFDPKFYSLLWLWAIVPFILASLPGLDLAFLSLPFRPIFFWRYLVPVAIPLSILIVYIGNQLPKKLFFLVITLIVILSLCIDYLTFLRYPYTFKQVYADKIIPRIEREDKIVTVLPSFAEVLYYRDRNQLENELRVLPEGLVNFSGKSLLDAYVQNGVVTINERPNTCYFEATPGPNLSTGSECYLSIP